MGEQDKEQFRMIVFGCVTVGSTALTLRFVKNCFVQEYDPVIEDTYGREAVVDGEALCFEVLDISECEEFTCLMSMYMRKFQAILLVYDVTNRSTFDKIAEFREQCCIARDSESVPVVLCGNKIDLADKRQVETSEGQKLAETYGWPFIETSAKTGENVEEAFFTIFRAYGHHHNDNDGEHKEKCIIC